jgi:hypothetical protein
MISPSLKHNRFRNALALSYEHFPSAAALSGAHPEAAIIQALNVHERLWLGRSFFLRRER